MTLRQLAIAAEGRGRSEWSHTSSILAMLANTHRDPKKGRALTPADFDPYRTADRPRKGVAIHKGNIGLLIKAFTDGKTKRD